MKSLLVAIKGKGIQKFLDRIFSLSRRYGLTPQKMVANLENFSKILEAYNCGATFPITGAAVLRNGDFISEFSSRNIEFALHGKYHIDHSKVSSTDICDDFLESKGIFNKFNLNCNGFRFPYLRWNSVSFKAVEQAEFMYEASPALYWDVTQGIETTAYRSSLEFYNAKPATEHPALPSKRGNLISIPYCIPDDESIIERLRFRSSEQAEEIWLAILRKTYKDGELFTLGLHPERIQQCKDYLEKVLVDARQYSPKVWIARLDEISQWWTDRTNSKIQISETQSNKFEIQVEGPDGVTFLTRNLVPVDGSEDWDHQYQIVRSNHLRVLSKVRPFIGLSTSTPKTLMEFLIQQGYIVEQMDTPENYSIFLDIPTFEIKQERQILKQIEDDTSPLVRLGRWPTGAKSALCITGDIDALTIWDYLYRLIGR